MIPEAIVDKSVAWVSENTEVATASFLENFPDMLSYLFSGQFDLLSNEENELMLFLFLVFNHSMNESQIDKFSMEQFHQKEEINWDLFENAKNLSWEEKLNICFKDYHQEDLLALVEDLLTEDENPILSLIGKEFILVTTKSFIDCIDI